MMKECNLVEFFSGIGSQAKALKNLNIKVNTIGTSEWDVHAIAAYDYIHNNSSIPDDIARMEKPELLQHLEQYTFSNTGKVALKKSALRTYSREVLQCLYSSVRRNHNFVDISSLSGNEMPDGIDVLTYSFPCQDLSNVGAFHGYRKGIDKDSGSRSSLLWQVGRVLTEMKESEKALPRYLLMENVPALLSKRHFTNFSTWIDDLEALGYVSRYYQLNASDFGLPQNRPRLLMISVYVGSDHEEEELVSKYFDSKKEDDIIADYKTSEFYHKITVQELLRTDYSNSVLFEEAVECTPNNTVSRQKIWDDNPQIVLPGYQFNPDIDVIRTITTKQDRNPNSGNLYFESKIEGRSHFRYLTPRECMLFMGFDESDYEKLKHNNLEFHKGDALFARDKIIRMSGNSIPVKLLEGVFLQILKVDNLLTEYRNLKKKRLGNEMRAEFIRHIRSELFGRKIRCRQGDVIGPEKADIVYPKYNTAVFIADCYEYGHECELFSPEYTDNSFWNEWNQSRCDAFQKVIANAENEGWNTIVVWYCELLNNRAYDTFLRIEQELRKNLTGGRHRSISDG